MPQELLHSGGPYPDFLRHLAENGYYGEGDADAHVAKRVESLRNPSGVSFEDHTPDGRWYRILRRPVAGGGAITVMTDITEQKLAEQDLADKEAQLHVALDNMPGALVYTDGELRIVVCNNRFKEMYIVPQELLQPGGRIPISCAIWLKTDTTARATSMLWSRSASRVCATRRGRASRITLPMAVGIGFCAAGWQVAAR